MYIFRALQGFRTVLALTAIAALVAVGGGPASRAASGAPAPLAPFGESLHVGTPVTHKALTLVPVIGPSRSIGALTLEEALAARALVVTEKGEGEVNELMVENRGKQPIFVMAGEILTGAKQDRIFQRDLLLPPHSGGIPVSVFCTEHGRWTSTSAAFGSGGYAANAQVRREAQVSKSQPKVWSAVAETQTKVSAAPYAPSGALNQTYSAPVVRRIVDDYWAVFKGLPERTPGMVGVVVMVKGKILVADVFGDRNMARTLWPKLAKSYILEAAGRQDDPPAKTPEDPAAFLTAATSAPGTAVETPGWGSHWDLMSSTVEGAALLFKTVLVHAALFPKAEEAPEPEPTYTTEINRPYTR